MKSVAEALEHVLAGVDVLEAESVPLGEALGRVLAEPVVSAREIPPWANSSMDGYAVRAADTESASREQPVTLAVVGEVAAGRVAAREVGSGQAYRILTGAPLPPGSDAVVPQEEVTRDGTRLAIRRAVQRGAYVRPRGEDIRTGDRILETGSVLRPAALGVLAALGRGTVSVYRRPTVAILSTGDELVEPDSPLGPGQIPDSNTYTLSGLAVEAGAVPLSLGIAPDRREVLVERFRQGLQANVLVSSAGVSVGDRDFVREAIEALGARLEFWQVNMRPGKPLTFGRIRRAPLLRSAGKPRVVDGHVRAVRPTRAAPAGRAQDPRPATGAGAGSRAHRQSRQPARLPPRPSRAAGRRAGRETDRRAGIGDPPLDAPG